jgi:hypothetical protein
MVNRTFTIASMGFTEFLGHFDIELGTLRFAVINDDPDAEPTPTIQFFANYQDALNCFHDLTQPEVV